MKQLILIFKGSGHLFMLLLAFSVIMLGVQSCRGDGDEPEVPKEVFRIYNEKDSAAFCEVLKTAYGDTLDKVCSRYGIKLDSVPSWSSSIVLWGTFDNLPQKRITGLNLQNHNGLSDQQNGMAAPKADNISPAIWEMDSIRTLILFGNLFQGEFPAPNGGGKCLRLAYLTYTNITSLPLEVFNLPSMETFQVLYAGSLESLPEGLDQIPAPDKYGDGITYKIFDCSLSGSAPVECPVNLSVKGNCYKEIDWEAFKRIDVESRLVKGDDKPFFVGLHMSDNCLSGTIPTEILTDTLRLIYLYDLTGSQQKGYGFSNMPDTDEMVRRRNEYCASHPEIAPLLSQIKIYPHY